MAYDNRRSNGDYGRKSYNRGGYGQKNPFQPFFLLFGQLLSLLPAL